MYTGKRPKLINRLKGFFFFPPCLFGVEQEGHQATEVKTTENISNCEEGLLDGLVFIFFVKQKSGLSNQPYSGRREYAQWAEHAPPDTVSPQPL